MAGHSDNGHLEARCTLRVPRDPTGSAACTPTAADREGRPIASRSDRRTSGLIERLLGARDLSDKTGDQALDLGRWQVVARIAVRQAHIAANHEGAQARLGEALCLATRYPSVWRIRGCFQWARWLS